MIILIAFLLYVKKRIQVFRVFMVLNALEWTVASISLSQTTTTTTMSELSPIYAR